MAKKKPSKSITQPTGARVAPDEIILQLPNGCSLRCGTDDVYTWGGYLRIVDGEGNEILYWDKEEWEATGEGASVIGAAFAAAVMPLADLIKGRVLVRGVWMHDKNSAVNSSH